jgi:tetratricopeptide (TPR) repeat protein
VASVISVTNIPPSTAQPTLPPPPVNASPIPSNVSPEINAAQELVNQNPGDPGAHLHLSLALWDAKEIRPAIDELAQAANLAGPNNKDFFLNAAQEFKKREAWVPAAGMYLRLVQSYHVQDVPKEIETDFHEAIYKSTEQKDMPLFVFFERIDNVDLSLGFVARGRYALYNGDVADAKTNLASAEKLKPDMYEVILLKAEIEAKVGSQAQAKTILLSLSSDLGAPEWLRFMAENFLKTLQ